MTAFTFLNTPPLGWIMAAFDGLDPKRYGAGLGALGAGVEVQPGVHLWRGRESVRESPRASNAVGGSRRRLHESRDVGFLRMPRGETAVTSSDTGQVAAPAIGHIPDMDENNRTKVRRWIGAFGPLN